MTITELVSNSPLTNLNKICRPQLGHYKPKYVSFATLNQSQQYQQSPDKCDPQNAYERMMRELRKLRTHCQSNFNNKCYNMRSSIPLKTRRVFDEIAWIGANTMFPMSATPQAVPVVGRRYAIVILNTLSAVTQSPAVVIYQIARVDIDEFVGKTFKIFKAPLLSVRDGQRERESRLRDFKYGITTEVILSKKSKEMFK
ncbi:MAG: hypothetical protein EZS28_047272, partial [Streblomastix strix]